MTIRFKTNVRQPVQAINMALESRYSDGKVIQVMSVFENRMPTLIYREGTSGKWLRTSGISFNGLPRTPENLLKAIGRADPVGEIYVMPAL